MKKNIAALLILFEFTGLFASDIKTKTDFIIGITPVSKTYETDNIEFDNAYTLADIQLSNDYVTAHGKLYYRLSMYDDSKDLDTENTLSQKLDIKRAYLKYRPLGNDLLEASIGKLYSNYLPGNFFSLAEIYTGSTRWGKTGIGIKYNDYGFFCGAALPVTESYQEFENVFGVNWALGYDFAHINNNIPLSVNAAFSWNKTHTESSKNGTTDTKDFSYSLSANYNPKLNGFISKLNTTLTFSWNSEPYVASSVFKNVTNYDAENLSESCFFSINQKNNFGPVGFVLEGETGHSLDGNWIPLYSGVQLLIPVVEHISLKPRFFYYAVLNSKDSDLSRETYECYPRLWITINKWTISAGCDFDYKQTYTNKWNWEWSTPFYIEYKL